MSAPRFDDGWIHWIVKRPGKRLPVQVMRDGWAEPATIWPDELHPMTNINGLYWRPTGIYHHFSPFWERNT